MSDKSSSSENPNSSSDQEQLKISQNSKNLEIGKNKEETNKKNKEIEESQEEENAFKIFLGGLPGSTTKGKRKKLIFF